jgi:hypothetical protein
MCVSQITSVPRFPWLDHHLDFLKMAQTKKKTHHPHRFPSHGGFPMRKMPKITLLSGKLR